MTSPWWCLSSILYNFSEYATKLTQQSLTGALKSRRKHHFSYMDIGRALNWIQFMILKTMKDYGSFCSECQFIWWNAREKHCIVEKHTVLGHVGFSLKRFLWALRPLSFQSFFLTPIHLSYTSYWVLRCRYIFICIAGITGVKRKKKKTPTTHRFWSGFSIFNFLEIKGNNIKQLLNIIFCRQTKKPTIYPKVAEETA